jgi:RNA polymerase sigma-70 factor (ECF subfamily)
MEGVDPFVTAFLAALPEGQRAQLSTIAPLGPRLREIVAEASAAWPDVLVESDGFLAYIAEKVPKDANVVTALDELHARDLYLAFACASGDRRALREFDTHFLSAVPRYVAKVDASPSFAEEVRQQLASKLFVAEGNARPKIMDYAGRGPLGGWLRVAAIRIARNLLRTARRSGAASDRGDPDEGELRSAAPDPELDYAKQHYSHEFKEAFAKTLSGLNDRERNILRMHYFDKMSSSAIAELYGVDGSTVRVWIKQWREAMLSETRKRLAGRLKMDTAELDQVMGLVESRLEMSISRLLRKKT